MVNSALFAIVFTLFGTSYAGSYGGPAHRNHYHGHAVAEIAPAGAAYKTGGPHGYRHSIPAAAIRNVETVGVTKTITPVVTKTTTRLTHSEPALSIGHVQGYTQTAIGSPKVAPVQFNTQYTSYSNPTVGVNGPVSYAGPAVATGYGIAAAGPALGYGGAHAHGHGYGAVAAHGYGVAPAAHGYVAAAPVAVSGYGGYGGYGYAAAAPAYGHQAAYAIPQTEYASQAVAVAEVAPALSIESYGAEAYEAPVAAFTDVHSGQAIYSNGGGHYGHAAYGRGK